MTDGGGKRLRAERHRRQRLHAKVFWRDQFESSPFTAATLRSNGPLGHTYTLLHREAPAEADFQRFFQVTRSMT